MKKMFLSVLSVIILVPATLTLAASTNGNGSGNANSTGSATSPSVSASENGNESSNGAGVQTQTQNQAQNQVQNQSQVSSTNTPVQTQGQLKVQEQVRTYQPQYTPSNSKSIQQRSVVANAVQAMLEVASRVENAGIGQQIRTIAQTQSQNQDRIGQAVDNAEKRSAFAKFFIGPNYKELTTAKRALEQNKAQVQTLEELMTGLTSDADKLAITNQIALLQSEQNEIRNQISDLSSGFSLFGWVNRLRYHFSI